VKILPIIFITILLISSCQKDEDPLPIHPMEGNWKTEVLWDTTVIQFSFGLKTVYGVIGAVQPTFVTYSTDPQVPIGTTNPQFSMNISDVSYNNTKVSFSIYVTNSSHLNGNNITFIGQQISDDKMKGYLRREYLVEIDGEWYRDSESMGEPQTIINRIKDPSN
jgi:hypothetical protein